VSARVNSRIPEEGKPQMRSLQWRGRRVATAVLCVVALGLVVGVGSAGAVVSQFGSRGEGAGEFRGVKSVAVDQATGDVYLFDGENFRIDKFSAEGSFLLGWGWGAADGVSQEPQTCTTACFPASGYGPAAGELAGQELGVAVDNDPLSVSYEDVYVLDQGNDRVDKFSPSGVFLGTFGREVNEDGANLCVAGEKCQAGKEGKGDYELETTRGAIAVDSNGDVFVGDHERVQVFSPEGVFVRSFAVSPEYPRSLAVDGAGDVYVLATENSRSLAEYDSSGTFLRTLDSGGEPEAVTVDSSGDVFVGNRTSVLEYGTGGEELAIFDQAHPTEDGVSGIAFGETIGRLYMPGQLNGSRESEVVRLLAPPPAGPLVESESVSGVEPQGATLDAAIDPENNDTTYRFEYGPTASYGLSVPSPEGSLAASFSDESVGVAISKLVPETTYHYRVVATDSEGHTTIGSDATFTTQPAVLIDSVSMTNVAATSATFEAELNPLGVDATYRIEYDTSEYTQGGPSHGTVVSEGPLGAGTIDVPIGTHVAGLVPSTLYHYRVVVQDTREGVSYTIDSPDRTFMTQPATGGRGSLPDGRSWEMVSPIDKQGATLEPIGFNLIQASVNGDEITYAADAPTETEPAGNRSPERAQVLSVRGAGGWFSQDIETPNDTPGQFFGVPGEYRLFSSDLSLGLVEPRSDTPLPPLPKGSERTVYVRNDQTGSYEALVTAANVPTGTKFGVPNQASQIAALDATPDLRHVVLQSPAALTSNAVQYGANLSLYEWTGGKLVLVSVLPKNGEPPANQYQSVVLGNGRDIYTGGGNIRHAVSDDGSRVVWMAGQATGQHLYLRDVVRGETVQVDAAQGVREVESSGALFQLASSDGSRVFFTSASRLTSDSTASPDKADLYAFEAMSASGQPLAGRLTDLTVDNHLGERADVQGVIGASEDGAQVYFAANGLLGDAGEDGAAGLTNLYVERYDSGTKAWLAPRFVAGLSSLDAPSWGLGTPELRYMSAHVSKNGRFLAFMSSRSLTGYDNRDANSGAPDEEVFLYDGDAGHLSCVSCNSTGARPVGMQAPDIFPGLLVDHGEVWQNRWLAGLIPGWNSEVYQSRYLFDSGRLFFDSADALAPGDTNGTWDVYEYEPRGVGGCAEGSSSFDGALGGCVGLISSGGSREESAFLDASETGDDAFFLTEAGLLPQDGDGLFDVYDARVCSDASPCLPAQPVAPPACSTSDSCKAAPTPQPESFGAPSSQTFSGAGNVLVPVPATVRSKSSTRAQKLSRALKACRGKPRRKRSACERVARRRYGQSARAGKSTINKSLPVRAGR
jgi:hypothetical protein